MYQLSEAQTQANKKKAKLALLFEAAIEKGTLDLPPMEKSRAISLRSQLNRYRAQMRGSQQTDLWDLVVNKLVQLTHTTWTIRMTFEKSLWEHIGKIVGVQPIQDIPSPQIQEHTPSLSEVLDAIYGEDAAPGPNKS